jgi:glycosyltransferase involved in cell wall biosynthesis
MADRFAWVSVVVPTFNRRDVVRQTVEAALGDEDALEIIVVVDGCHDGTLETLGELAERHPRLRPIWTEHAGEMQARARGAGAARGDVVLFLDDDVLAAPGLVRAHAGRHRGVSDAVVVGYMPVAALARDDADWPTTYLYAGEYERRVAEYERDASGILRHLWGGNFSMRRSDCLAVGMADTCYQARYYPDRDFGLRCLGHGMVGVFAREALATHLYRRPLALFVEDARSQGEGHVLLHRLHADVLGPTLPGSYDAGVPLPARAVIRLGSRTPPLDRAWTGLLARCVRMLGRLRLRGVQIAALRVLRRTAQAQGARDELTKETTTEPARMSV